MKKILTGIKPTGEIHLGYLSTIENIIKEQNKNNKKAFAHIR